MDERQESEWLYAKSLELAILIKGKLEELPEEPFMYNDFITKHYSELATKIAYRIINSATELKRERKS
jgi:hypothetical protein